MSSIKAIGNGKYTAVVRITRDTEAEVAEVQRKVLADIHLPATQLDHIEAMLTELLNR